LCGSSSSTAPACTRQLADAAVSMLLDDAGGRTGLFF
jgi:hypothetical protein